MQILFLLLLLAVATYAQPQPTLQDKRDGKKYKTVKIGKQIWLAENLNYNAEGSACYEDKPDNCKKYGRLYDLKTARNACPKGWHLPNCYKEWELLETTVNGNTLKLKTKSGWDWNKKKYRWQRNR